MEQDHVSEAFRASFLRAKRKIQTERYGSVFTNLEQSGEDIRKLDENKGRRSYGKPETFDSEQNLLHRQKEE
jgi:hypothetical protein